jgi:hypothetical protein
VLLPKVQICQHRFVDSFDISLHLFVDLLTPLRNICPSKVPVTISLFENFIDAIKSSLASNRLSRICTSCCHASALLLHCAYIKMLCDRCSIAISDTLTCDLDSSRWRVEPLAPGSRVFYLGDNRRIVETSSRKICFVCQTTHRWLSSQSRDQFEPFDNGESKSYLFCVPLKYASSEPLQPWINVIPALPTLEHAHKQLRISSVPSNSTFAELHLTNLAGGINRINFDIKISPYIQFSASFQNTKVQASLFPNWASGEVYGRAIVVLL